MFERLRQNPDIIAIAVLCLVLGFGHPGTFGRRVSAAPSTFGVRLIRTRPARPVIEAIKQAIRQSRSASECPFRLEVK